MKKSAIRVAAAAAVAGLFATMAPLSAFAATAPAWDTTSDGLMYLMDGTTATQSPAGSTLDWNYGNTIVATALPPVDITDLGPLTFPAPTGGANDYIGFISPVGSERTKSAWKSYGSASPLNGVGALLPSVFPGYFGNGAPAAVKAAGGTYSMGIAYMTNNDLTVVKAYYTTINVDAGTGNWAFATYVPPVQATDVATTTTLAALPTSVETGQTTVLTATVAAPGKTVTGNVQFFEGATQIGTGALAAGTASKTVTVGTAGTHTYSAKFVENTVGTDKFLASTSANVDVTATVAAVPLPPNGPTESTLNASTANGASAGYDAATKTASLNNIPATNNGKSVNVFAYSTPTYLGTKTVTGGTVTVDVSTLPAGVHKLVITDPTTGDVIAWASFTKSDAATQPTISKTINADVAALTPADGEFSLTNLSGAVVNLTNPALVNGASVVSGELGNFKVTDLRQVTKPGWTLKTDVAQFVKGTDTIENSALGIAPKVVSQAGTGATAPTLGAATVSGSASYPWSFATLAGTKFSGVSTYNADLVFTAPAGKPAGTYTSTLTLTLVSN